ncbi:uncharacterized protein [Malus domestica]|uniref:uncharacterized protein isoform X2 n=1 Tax=Malus domestica TaxID=3750 RepID=UPI003976A211
MSSILSSLFSIFFLFLSMHACEARYIGLGPKGFGAPFLPFGKGLLLLEKFKTLGMDSSKGFVMKEYDAAEKGHGGAITSTTTPVKEVKCTSRGHKSGMEPAGSEIVESSDHHMMWWIEEHMGPHQDQSFSLCRIVEGDNGRYVVCMLELSNVRVAIN